MTTGQRHDTETVRLAGRAVSVRLTEHALEDGKTWAALTVTVRDDEGKVVMHANLSTFGKEEQPCSTDS